MMCISFSSRHATGKIVLPVIYPATAEPQTAFDITYTVKNTGNTTGTIYGYLTQNNVELTGSRWSQRLNMNSMVTKNYRHPGITGKTQIILRVGYS